MIYRILVDERLYDWLIHDWVVPDPPFGIDEDGEPVYGTLGGIYSAGFPSWYWSQPDTPRPNGLEITNRRCRFYFTERGWREVGRHMAAGAKRDGHVVKVIRRKNPDPSQVVYADDLQVAILPRKVGAGSHRSRRSGRGARGLKDAP